MYWRTVLGMLTVLLGFLALGCSGGDGKLGYVEGVVKLDGTPLANAQVEFHPKEGGRSSIANTDEDGHYVLKYSMTEDGALVGKHIVKITIGKFEDGKVTVPEKVPAKYNYESDLLVDVESGSQDIPFDLKSGGPIIQPGQDGAPRNVGGGKPSCCGEAPEDW